MNTCDNLTQVSADPPKVMSVHNWSVCLNGGTCIHCGETGHKATIIPVGETRQVFNPS